MNPRLGCLVALVAVGVGCSDAEVVSPAEGGTPIWGRRFGKSTSMDRVGVAVDAEGNVVVGGRFFATADFGGGPVTSPANNWQAFVAKYDRAGALLWMHSLGDVYEEEVTHVGVDAAGNVYVAGDFRGTLDLGGGPLASEGFDGDLFVAKLTPGGGHLWSKRFGVSGSDSLWAMAVEPGGSIALLGRVGDGTDFGTGPVQFASAPFVARLEASGEAAFVTSFENSDMMSLDPIAIAHGASGTFVASTSYSYTSEGPGTAGLVVSELTPTGEVARSNSYSSDGGADVSAMALGPDGSLFLSGRLGTYIDFGNAVTASGDASVSSAYVVALTRSGAPRWLETFTHDFFTDENGNTVSGGISVRGLAASATDVVVTGGYSGTIDFGGGKRESQVAPKTPDEYGYAPVQDDVFVVRLDAKGGYDWDASFGDPEMQHGTAVALDPSGDVLIAGSAKGPLPFAPGTFDGTAYYEGFVVKLAR